MDLGLSISILDQSSPTRSNTLCCPTEAFGGDFVKLLLSRRLLKKSTACRYCLVILDTSSSSSQYASEGPLRLASG
eukprot:2293939-Rhodomonas_salina.4